VAAPLIALVIPSSAVPRRREHGVPGRIPTPLPLASAPDGPPAPGDLVYGVGRIDASGTSRPSHVPDGEMPETEMFPENADALNRR
jgi:hypothetical protein